MKQQYEDEPGIARLCSKLMRMTKRISGITGGLLTFSKARGGILDKHPLHGALDGALELVRSRFDFEQKRLVRDYPKKLPSVWCDSDQLQQVFVNIAINALEAMRKDNTLTVSARTSRKDKTVTLRFADNGKGMTVEEVKRAFDPFYTTKETGSGLGLAISHSIIEEHGGRITITSRPGEGTAVSVALPVYEPRQPRARTGPRRPNRKKQEE
jgi:signal transduction histidine kinase